MYIFGNAYENVHDGGGQYRQMLRSDWLRCFMYIINRNIMHSSQRYPIGKFQLAVLYLLLQATYEWPVTMQFLLCYLKN